MSFWKLRRSLLWTFTGAFLVVLLAGIAVQAAVIAGVLRPAVLQWRQTTRNAIARSVAASTAEALSRGENDLAAVLRRDTGDHRNVALVFRDRSGEILASHNTEGMRPRIGAMLRRGDRGRGPRFVGRAPVLVDGEPRGEILVMPRFPDAIFRMEGTPRLWLLFLPLAAILAGIAGFLLFRGLSRRLALLEDRVIRIAEGDLDVRVTGVGQDEIGRLGEAFNVMSERLRESRERIVEADRLRRRFLADVTHDLATPLTTIRGYAETLLDPNVPKSGEETERYLRFIQEEAVRMDALVSEILDLARVESGNVPLDRVPTDLLDLARGEVERIRPAFDEARLRIEGPGTTALGVEIPVDRRRIEQLLSNLIGNALQHLAAGGTARVRVERTGQGGARIVVEDDGPGFRPEDLPHLFERFYRGNPARPSGGTGLGLAIVRGIARAHGGEATAEIGEGGGARVVVELPGWTAGQLP